MTGPQHFAEAQRLLEGPHRRDGADTDLIARAQAHATLANAAARMFPYHDEDVAEAEYKEWLKAMRPAVRPS